MKLIPAIGFVVAVFLVRPSMSRAGTILFDSFTPPSAFGGFSSANGGVATQLSVTFDVSITNVAVLNQMLGVGNLRFAILSHPEHQFLYLSPPKQFPLDQPNILTWKQSDSFAFTFEAGETYLVGYLRSVASNDYVDSVSESAGGVTSDLAVHCLLGFSTPTYSHQCFTGVDQSVRLLAVPEPSSLALLLLAVAWRSTLYRRG